MDRSVRLGLVASVLAIGVIRPVVAQEARVRTVQPCFAGAAKGSLAWFQHGLELVEANVDVDLREAQRVCASLVEAAPAAVLPGVEAATSAAMAMVLSYTEGPLPAAEWLQRAGELPNGVDAQLRVHYFLARVRLECARGAHDEEMPDWLAAKAAAEESQRVLLRLRVFSRGAHTTPARSMQKLHQFFRDAEAVGQADDVAHLRSFLAIQEFNAANDENRPAEKARLRAEVEKLATELGNRRLRTVAKVNEANDLYVSGQKPRALSLFREIESAFDGLGDRRELFGVRNMLGWVDLRAGNLDAVDRWIEGNRGLVEGRGFEGCEKELLRMRFELAVERKQSELAAQLKRQFDEVENMEAAVVRRTHELRERLHSAERDKESVEEQLRAAEQQAAARLTEARMLGASVVVVALVLLVGISWRSRRRLLLANVRLAEQVRAVEAAKAAQHKLEERMRELERVESLGTMAAGVAHDFNNLLTSILGSAELLQREGGERDRFELTEAIQRAGDQAARLCQQLQAYAGGTPTERVPLDLLAVAREMLPALQAATKGVVGVEVESPLASVGVLGDRAQLEQVLLNLVTNARDAGARRVRIRIEDVLDETASGDARTARLTVVDDGEGMSPEVQQRIFDPFFTTRFPGRGLGLAVVHGVVRRHGGRIDVHSAKGKGSTFVIALPRAETPDPVVVVPRGTEPLPVPALSRVFVVDDDDAVRGMLARMLATLGARTHVAEYGEAMLAAAAETPRGQPLIAFVDLSMPGMDGLEVVRRLRAMRPEASIVLMSGHPVRYVEQVAGDLRIDAVLTKPFLLDDVRSLLLRLQPVPAASTSS